MQPVIEVRDLTKDYGAGRGVFHVDLLVDRGLCFGFLGPNGAGKTTTIRHLMGFSRPDSGQTLILGQDTWQHSADLQQHIGYLPGEIAFPKGMRGDAFLRYLCRLRGVREDAPAALLKEYELDPAILIERMSLGMRRKLAIVAAFMHDPAILILDEPTSGLDPVMQETFIAMLQREKERGKTILLSSHIFHEVDAACDRISVIRSGKILETVDPEGLKNTGMAAYRITFADRNSLQAFRKHGFTEVSHSDAAASVTVRIEESQTAALIRALQGCRIKDFTELPFSLEEYFMQFYEKEAQHD